MSNGFKSDYTSGDCPEFSAFIRAILGLGYIPLSRFREGIRNLYVLAKRLTGSQRSFAKRMIDYVSKYWVNGSYHPETWVMFQHDGETTNNHSEGYNSRLASKKVISKHPNVYKFVEAIIKELENSLNDAMMAKAGNVNAKQGKRSKQESLIKKRENLMKQLEDGVIDILSYQGAVGGSILQSTKTSFEVDTEFDDCPLESHKRGREEGLPVQTAMFRYIQSSLSLLTQT